MSEEPRLQMERTISAPPERVFEAFIKPELMAKWMGPHEINVVDVELEAETDGAWHILMRNTEGQDFHVSGVYKTIEPPHRLAMTWAWRQEDGSRGHETLVTLTFKPHSQGTLLHLNQETFKEKEHRDRHSEGWSGSFDKLVALFETADA